MEVIKGTNKNQYNLLQDYCEELKKCNISSTIILHSTRNGDGQILEDCVFILKHAHKILQLDVETFNWFGWLFFEREIWSDMYPIAYVVVKTENNEN